MSNYINIFETSKLMPFIDSKNSNCSNFSKFVDSAEPCYKTVQAVISNSRVTPNSLCSNNDQRDNSPVTSNTVNTLPLNELNNDDVVDTSQLNRHGKICIAEKQELSDNENSNENHSTDQNVVKAQKKYVCIPHISDTGAAVISRFFSIQNQTPEHILKILQQPVRARMIGFSEKDR